MCLVWCMQWKPSWGPQKLNNILEQYCWNAFVTCCITDTKRWLVKGATNWELFKTSNNNRKIEHEMRRLELVCPLLPNARFFGKGDFFGAAFIQDIIKKIVSVLFSYIYNGGPKNGRTNFFENCQIVGMFSGKNVRNYSCSSGVRPSWGISRMKH